MKTRALVCALVVSSGLFAGTCLADPLMPPLVGSNSHSRLAELGGLVIAETTGPRLVIANAQNKVDSAIVHETVDQIARLTRVPNELRVCKNKDTAIELAEEILNEGRNKVAFVVVLCSENNHRSLLIAPENRWAIVNISSLSADAPSPQILQKRVQREIWRATCQVMGCANSINEGCVMKPIFTSSDLDSLPQTICPEPLSRIQTSLAKLGVQPLRIAPYRKAAQEGWAPDPTNDVQRAIWQEFKNKK